MRKICAKEFCLYVANDGYGERLVNGIKENLFESKDQTTKKSKSRFIPNFNFTEVKNNMKDFWKETKEDVRRKVKKMKDKIMGAASDLK